MTKRLAVVISCVDAPAHAEIATKYLKINSDPALTTIVLLDNGSQQELPKFDADILIRLEENVGGNGAIGVAHHIMSTLRSTPIIHDITAYLHCDMVVREMHWDHRVIAAFDSDPLLALAGFVGSSQCDEFGGRGSGTMLNYLGEYYEGFGQCCPAETHGMREPGVKPAANLDHCAMIFKSEKLEQLLDVPYCPTHFYDRSMAIECNYRGWHVAHIGILCDHFNGGTAAGVVSQDALIRSWLTNEKISFEGHSIYQVLDADRPAIALPSSMERPDVVMYRESERRFLARYRDTLGMVPFFVEEDYSHTYWSHNGSAWIPRKDRCVQCRWNRACPKHW